MMTNIEHSIHQQCIEKKLSLAFAESCTGGALAARVTKHSGASKFFLGSIVCYSNDIKTRILKVDNELIEKAGASSLEVTKALWNGVLTEMKSDLAVAITGIAGPEGGTLTVPVGTVFIVLGSHLEKRTYEMHFLGDRQDIILQAVDFALEKLNEILNLI